MKFGIITLKPLDFKLDLNRIHSYADGKGLSTLTTAVIKDQFGNIIKNGTLVSFLLKSGYNTLKIYEKTINGIAQIKCLHPNKAQNFEVLASINGLAKSNTINITYKLK